MKKCLIIILLASCFATTYGQMYFPPNAGNSWDTLNGRSLAWCTEEWDTVENYLQAAGSKSFIVLYRGKIVKEKYFGNYQPDSVWYWASAGKTLMAYLIGRAQDDGQLNIGDKTSDYLDTGWTSAPLAKEDLIKVQDQLQMSTGLDYTVPDLDCTADSCLQYRADAGSQWYYHNAPYLLLHDVLESATGKTTNQYVFSEMHQKIGFSGFWAGTPYISTARAMARFGLLLLNEGKWNNNQLLQDTAYFRQMISSSQNLNPAYGYLSWLNGKNSFIQPGLSISFPGAIVPDAPSDMYMAAGKNEQRIYVVPSLDLVVVRQGNAAGPPALALSGFDDELWQLLNRVINCQGVGNTEVELHAQDLYPNPAKNQITLPQSFGGRVSLYHLNGAEAPFYRKGNTLYFSVPPGMYLLQDLPSGQVKKFLVE